ncbi:DUF6966 domain-containing protein [Phytopseudomonas punonensis]|uniref:DUF6966 domain-containing protein n=1 Tax=Phytopseudomonas punonensis TaxID=1220495 RepID=A0A1M7DMT4_9GAMM|nr:hypothetical protein [Pseudomonas punonensis]SHL80673.1 hypothetical protein SAMN05216288_2505 [Pseudomonas punonensis]
MTNPQTHLNELIAHLAVLTDILALDADSHWGAHFHNCLTTARSLVGSSHDGEELAGLACSVMSVYGGMGSFNDYAPWQNGRCIAGMESLDEASNRVYMAARAIRLRNATDAD